MSTQSQWRTDPVDWHDPTRSVVVGIDGSPGNEAAIGYAVTEAVDSARPLTLVSVCSAYGFDLPGVSATTDSVEWSTLHQVCDHLASEHPTLDLRRDLRAGDPVEFLLNRSVGQAMLVVGRRGLTPMGRLLLGSTSTGVAGRSRVPVVVVPHGWAPELHRGEHVVVGVDLERDNAAALDFAFAVARRRATQLVVVSAHDIGAHRSWDGSVQPAATTALIKREAEAVNVLVHPLRNAWPDVSVAVRQVASTPRAALLKAATHAQLLVLGRHDSGRFGFPLGSVARTVLPAARVPVAIVPSD